MDAIKKGGSSIRNFSNISGKTGNFQTRFKVYDREGLTCKRLYCYGIVEKNFWLRDRLFFVILVKNELLFD